MRWFMSNVRNAVIFSLTLVVASAFACSPTPARPHAPETAAAIQPPEEVSVKQNDEPLRVVALGKVDPMVLDNQDERFEVFAGEHLLGRVKMTGRYAYSARPRVEVRDPAGLVVFDALWDEPFVEYEAIAADAARKHLLSR